MNNTLERLKRQMKRYGVTQHRVAAAAGVDRTMVNKVINGRAVSKPVLEVIRVMVGTARDLQ